MIDEHVRAEPDAEESHRSSGYFDVYENVDAPLWFDDDTLRFLFSIRYNSNAFAHSYLQESYRERTHAEFSDIIKELIRTKIETLRSIPPERRRVDPRMLTLDVESLKDNQIITCARSLGIDVASKDVLALVYSVVTSLQDLLCELIDRHPHLTATQATLAKRFLDDQLWAEDIQLEWRAVSAPTIARMYAYDQIPRTIVLINAMTSRIEKELTTGCLQDRTAGNADLSFILSDDVIANAMDLMADNANDPDAPPLDMDIANIVSEAINGPDDDGWG